MPNKQPQLAMLTRPRLHNAVAAGLVTGVAAVCRECVWQLPGKREHGHETSAARETNQAAFA